MRTVVLALVSVVGVSLVSLVGVVTLPMKRERVARLATIFVSFAVGALLADTFVHLVPDTFAAVPHDRALGSSLLILAGILLFFVVEKLLRHHHGVLHGQHHPGPEAQPVLATINILGDAVHNFIDGLVIGASYLVGVEVGLATTLAVLLHEIPQEFGDFAILVHSGLTVRKAALLNLASAAIAVLGTAFALAAGVVAHERVVALLVPITAGGFVYIAAADLIPELQHDHSLRGLLWQTLLIAAGIGVIALV